MVLDILLLLVIALIIAASAAAGLIRALFMALILYLLSLLLGALVLGFGLAHFLNDLIVGSLGGAERTPLFYQAIVFIGLLIPVFVGGTLLTGVAFENTSIPGLSWGDNILGTVVGVFVAITFAALIANAWGVMVSEPWQPVRVWVNLRRAFDTSAFTPYLMDVLRVYRKTLLPFAASRYPIFFIPQAWLGLLL